MKCHKCNNYCEIVDGSKVGGMPGIKYYLCVACGWTRAIVRKVRKGKLQ